MKKREVIEFEIGKMAFGGISYTNIEDKVVKMKGGITGQRVKAYVKKLKKDQAEAKQLELLEKSPLETAPVCKHFGECGGCSMLSVPYEKQVEIKLNQIKDLFEDVINDKEKKYITDDFKFEGIESSISSEEYRNKMEFTFGNEMKDGPLTLGMHKKGRHIDIMTVDDCRIVDEDFRQVLTKTVEYFSNKPVAFYNTRAHLGYLRNLVVRKGINTNQLMVNLVTTSQLDEGEKALLDGYVDALKGLSLKAELKSMLHTVNDCIADTVRCDSLSVLFGDDHIYEEVLGLRFKISPFSFFQTNTLGAEKLYSIVREYAGEQERRVIYDLYSGTGTIGQIMAKKGERVYGIELIEEAVAAANENAQLNGLDNCKFIAGDVAKTVKDLGEAPDLIIVDPPRPGVHRDAIRDICGFNSEEIVYVSCNPQTLRENIEDFAQAGYRVKRMRLMDMFPNTPHCECVALITRNCNDFKH